jgi:hypothetical protein
MDPVDLLRIEADRARCGLVGETIRRLLAEKLKKRVLFLYKYDRTLVDWFNFDSMSVELLQTYAQQYGVHHAVRPEEKCWHGVLVYQHYCEVCAWEKIDPDYKTDTYADAIDNALWNARLVLVGGKPDRALKQDALEHDETEGSKNFKDVRLLVDFEIWKAAKKYGTEMNAALAYTVARNTAQKFLADLIEERTILVGLALKFATTRDQEAGERLLDEHGGIKGVDRLAHDDRADTEDRQLARRLINEYGQRVSRFESFDKPVETEDGKGEEVSAAQLILDTKRAQEYPRTDDAKETFEDHRPALQALVATWRGDQRKVGEAMLKSGFIVRGVPGVSKSTVSRIYPVVVRAFKALIQQAVTK